VSALYGREGGVAGAYRAGERRGAARDKRHDGEGWVVGEAQPDANLLRGGDAACPLSTRGGTRLVRLVRGRGGGAPTCSAAECAGGATDCSRENEWSWSSACAARRVSVTSYGTWFGGRSRSVTLDPARAGRVQLVRRDGRDVSTLYGREGGGRRQPARSRPP